MHHRIRAALLTAVGAMFSAVVLHGGQDAGGLRLMIRADRTGYLPGEPVNVDIKVVNLSPAPALIPEGADVWVGHLDVLIAFEDGRFKEYRGPGWGLRDAAGGGSITLHRGQAHRAQATILYNHGVDTDHLNARRAKEIAERFLATGYALGTPGRYQLKARLRAHGFSTSIESEPIQITVAEPTGLDREVWEVLKTDPDYGYFIQSGAPRGHPTGPKAPRLVETLERIATGWPLSRYAGAIERSLARHREVFEDLRARGLVAY